MSAPPGTVVTAAGVVSAAGCGLDEACAAFASGRIATAEVERSDGYHLAASARLAFAVDDAGLHGLVAGNAARRMCRSSRFAVAAARLAAEAAGLSDRPEASVAVVLSTAYGPSRITESLTRQILFEGPEATSPAQFTESVANAPAAQVALAVKARGANVTITQRQAGALLAVGRGAAAVRSSRAAAALVGAVDEVTPLLHAILDRFRALARPRAGLAEFARPFDRRRNGVVLGEGCTVLAIEDAEAAARDGRDVLARIVSTGRAFDPAAPQTGWGRDPGTLAAALRRDLDAARVDVGSIDAIVSGAAGSRDGDRLEALVLREAWGDVPLPPVFAPKAYLGDHGGALLAGAVALASGTAFSATPGFGETDPELELVPHGASAGAPPTRLLVISIAAGGATSWIVLDSPNR